MQNEKQDFPMMIYHIVLGNKTVQNQDELQKNILMGWTKNYEVVNDYRLLKDKKAYYEKELEVINKKLKCYVDAEQKESEGQAESDSVQNIKIEMLPEKIKKRGRPRRGG